MKTGNLDGQGIAELRNYNFQNLATAPTTNLYKGRVYFNTTDNTLYIWDGTKWVDALSQGDYTFQNGIEQVTNTRNIQLKFATGGNAGNVTLSADSNGLKGEITELSIDNNSTDYLNITNHKLSANVDTTVSANSSNLVTSGAVQSAISLALSGALKYQTTWTATGQSDYSSITLPVYKGYMYPVNGSTTISGIEWNSGDYLVINKDIAVGSAITSLDVEKIDNTEASDIVRLNSTQTLTNKTIDADDNTISDLEVDNFKSGVVRTSTDGIRDTSTATDTSIVTEKAIANKIASRIFSDTNSALTQSGGVCTWSVTHNLNSNNVGVFLYEVTSGDRVMFDYSITSANALNVKILSANDIIAGVYKIVVQG